MSQYKIEAGTGQHIGDRQEQQDRVALLTAPLAPGYVMAIVADGMGGVSGGALAAEQVVRTAKQAFDRFSPQTDDVETMLATLAHDAHTIIKLSAISTEKNPHSTMVALVLTPDGSAIWAHTGDSRLYSFKGQTCIERTADHSYVGALVGAGILSAEAARDHHLANVLTSSLGSHENAPQVSIQRRNNLQAGDSFLLCSDGLWQYFSDAELGAIIAANVPRQASEMLINTARHRAAGNPADNCTLAIVKLVEQPHKTKAYTVEKMQCAV